MFLYRTVGYIAVCDNNLDACFAVFNLKFGEVLSAVLSRDVNVTCCQDCA
jgi:hypothetical protein